MTEVATIGFLLNGRSTRLSVRRDQRLLDLLREELHLTGAKEGCGKGECGACTVIVNGEAVDSCLMLASQVDGCRVETIEGLGRPGQLHPLQEAFVEEGACQCGICIPGTIMAAKALLDHCPRPSVQQIRRGLAGNLCRCTGYTKIVRAVDRAAAQTQRSGPSGDVPAPVQRAATLSGVLEELRSRPELRPIAGGTDLLVRARDGLADPERLIDISGLPELRGIEQREGRLWIGAATSHAELLGSSLVTRWAPALGQACAVIGGPQIRNRGTLGGNLANASPAADTVPPLLAGDAAVELVSAAGLRELSLAELFTGPGSSSLEPGELIQGVSVPCREGVRGAFLRLGQRQAQAISKVSVALVVSPDHVGVACGAVAPTVIRIPEAESCLLERSAAGLAEALEAVRRGVRPIDDLRSSREYRRDMAAVLLERAFSSLAEPASP